MTAYGPATQRGIIAHIWNQAHPDERPFNRIWHDGDSAPPDWDGAPVLFCDDTVFAPAADAWKIVGNIIAYRSKPASATSEPDDVWPTYNPETHSLYDHQTHVAVEIMPAIRVHNWTSVEWAIWARKCGIIRPEPTQAERIASETGLTVDQVQAVLDAQNE